MTDAGTVVVTDHPFRDLDIERTILEPKGYSDEALRELQRKAAENLLDALAGRRPRYPVNSHAIAEASS